jgi:two-component system sensor histidine kinase RpfC
MLILDKNMPERSGIEVVKSLRFMDSSHSMPVIMLTADATPEAREESINAGANAHLTKPINVRELLDKIALLSRNIKRQEQPKTRYKKTAVKSLSGHHSESEWIDETVLQELAILGGDIGFVKGLVGDFINDGSRHIERINAAAGQDYPELREALHALKGSSSELGATKLVEICLKAEALKPYEIGTDQTQAMVREVTRIFNLTCEALSATVADVNKFRPHGTE